MTRKAEFNAEEWATLIEAPGIAGLMVITAQRGGTLRESLAIGKTYAEARERHAGPELVNEIIDSPPEVNPGRWATPEEVRTGGAEQLRQAATIVDERATAEEADAYKRFVVDLAQRAAESHKSGGFLGVGGERVSDTEAAALAEIAAALDVPYPPPEEPATAGG